MSTFTSDPGVRLGGRYRLSDKLAAAAGWSAWKAIDEILARPVSVITFAAGFPRLEQVITAARAASRLTDTRLTQVFDVEDDWNHGYVVLEWPVGDTLGSLLAERLIEPDTAARIVAETASALAGAHAAGLAHLCLRPETIRWTAAGGIKVTGLGIDAALSGVVVDDPQRTDTEGLGQLLYAALTGTWPGPESPELPPAPRPGGVLARPCQVRPGVSDALDEIAWRALDGPGLDPQAAFTSPAELAAALPAAIPPAAIPAPPPSRPAARRLDWPREPQTAPRRQAPIWAGEAEPDGYAEPGPDGYGPQWAPRRRHPGRAVGAAVAALIVVLAIAAGAVHELNRPPSAVASGQPSARASAPGAAPTPASVAIAPISASGFDAMNPADGGDEHSIDAPNVLNGNPAGWSTQHYDYHATGPNPTFGNSKSGTGLILDLGKSVKVTSVTVQFGSQPGANVRLLAGNSNTRSPANVESMAVLAQASNVSGSHTFTVKKPSAGRYLVIWFTQLAPSAGDPGKDSAQVFSVQVKAAA